MFTTRAAWGVNGLGMEGWGLQGLGRASSPVLMYRELQNLPKLNGKPLPHLPEFCGVCLVMRGVRFFNCSQWGSR